jgi:hypothetical protein
VVPSFEEFFAMPLLKLLDLSRESGLCDVNSERSFTEVQFLCDGDKSCEVTEIGALIHEVPTWKALSRWAVKLAVNRCAVF